MAPGRPATHMGAHPTENVVALNLDSGDNLLISWPIFPESEPKTQGYSPLGSCFLSEIDALSRRRHSRSKRETGSANGGAPVPCRWVFSKVSGSIFVHEKRHLTIRALQANLAVSGFTFPAHPFGRFPSRPSAGEYRARQTSSYRGLGAYKDWGQQRPQQTKSLRLGKSRASRPISSNPATVFVPAASAQMPQDGCPPIARFLDLKIDVPFYQRAASGTGADKVPAQQRRPGAVVVVGTGENVNLD
ncbi:hypothetical protein B0I37DRAFT_401468 [Chaetomium sp. MPI-CAGE-AT-0009]|nr:hypothetical protein B0I37DRAFT_401468 [Chaetomium sp. MPI-CAGE-AT-0009]